MTCFWSLTSGRYCRAAAEVARDFAESEFEKFRIVQDRLFESDFDRVVKQVEAETQDTADKPETIKQLEDAAKRVLDKQ